jgi:predicted Zn-ribbon and HTH transcriptional regulator
MDTYNRRRQSALGKMNSRVPATCSACGREYLAENVRIAEYCSSSCRAKAWRARRKAEGPSVA